MDDKTIGAILAAVNRETQTVGSDPAFQVVPAGYTVQSLDTVVEKFERFQERPGRIKAAVEVDSPPSFVEYFGKYSDMNSMVFAGAKSIVGILDYHGSEPAWREHRVTLKLSNSPEWTDWKTCNKKQMSQQEFAEFIDNHLPDIHSPTGAAVLECVRTLEAKKDVKFSSGIRLSDGQVQFQYIEEIKQEQKPGALTLPDTLTLGIRIYQHEEIGHAIDARIRWRINSAALVFWYDLVRPERAEEQSFKDVCDAVKQGIDATFLFGRP